MPAETSTENRRPTLVGSLGFAAGFLGLLFWVPLMWTVEQNRHSLQLVGESQLIASVLVFLVPAVVLAAADHLLTRRSATTFGLWRCLLLAIAVGWVLFVNVNFENDSFVPVVALVLAALAMLWLVRDLVRHIAPSAPMWVRNVAMLASGVMFALFLRDAPIGSVALPLLVTFLVLTGLARALGGRTLELGSALFESIGICTALATLVFIGHAYWIDSDNARRADAATPGTTTGHERGPVFIFVFDGMSREALLDERGEIMDRFPTLQQLASEGIWIRDATTNFDHTSESIPSMLLGRFEEHYQLSDPPALFDHLSGQFRSSVRGVVIDYCTALAQSAVETCLDQRHYFDASDASNITSLFIDIYARTLPSVLRPQSDGPAGLDEAKRASIWLLDQLVADVERSPLHNRLYFTHVLTPHAPFVLASDGAVRSDGSPMHFRTTRTREELARALENYRTEIEFNDRFLARLIALLKARGLWAETTLIVTADHGYTWEWDTRTWGNSSLRNLVNEQIARIPMFVKPAAGFQPAGADLHYRSIDLIPTLLDLLDLAPLPGARLDGQSAFSARSNRSPVEVISTTGRPWIFDENEQRWRERSDSQ